jgi:hypothetical protein
MEVLPLYDGSYSPDSLFFLGDSNEKLFFGIELETETYNESKIHSMEVLDDDDFNYWEARFPTQGQNRILHLVEKYGNNFCFCKGDCSLHNGVEIVTYPLSWDWSQKNQKQINLLLARLCQGRHLSKTKRSCGFHIHMSKAAFSMAHLYKFAKFIYGNKEFCQFIGQRVDTYYAIFNEEFFFRGNDRSWHKIPQDTDKYLAIRVDSETSTIELRFFKGTLEKKEFWKNLEFCKALYDFTKQKSVISFRNYAAQSTILQKFVDFVYTRQKQFSNLYNFIKKSKYNKKNYSKDKREK